MAEKEKRERTKLNIKNTEEFPKTSDSWITTSRTLGAYVNSLFGKIFADYTGCKIYSEQQLQQQGVAYNPAHPTVIELYFSVGQPVDTNNKIMAFRQLSEAIKTKYASGARRNVSQAIFGFNAVMSTNRSTEITQEAIDILLPMLWYDVARNMSNDPTPEQFANKVVVETSTPAAMGNYGVNPSQRNIYNIVKFVDIDSILYTLFNDADDEPYAYQTVPIKPAGFGAIPGMNASEIKWLFSVTRLNRKKLQDIYNELGLYNNGTSSMNINTVTI